MGIDLMGVFKSDKTAKPFVSSVVVFAHPDEAMATAIQETIKEQGFQTDRVQKSDEGETLVYAQTDQPDEVMIVRLGDHALASVANLPTPEGWVGDLIAEHGFFPDLKAATGALYDQIALVAKSETPQADAKAMLQSFGQYLDTMMVLPANCYKLDEAIAALVQKAEEMETEADGIRYKEGEPIEEVIEDAVEGNETEDEKKKRLAKHPPAEMAPKDEEDDQKPPPDSDFVTGETQKADEKVEKTEEPKGFQEAVIGALNSFKEATTTQLTALTKKLETVVTEQSSQKKVLDEVVQKADTLNTALKTTVTAPPTQDDRPSQARMRVQKDDDPRTGNFDTAFMRKRR